MTKRRFIDIGANLTGKFKIFEKFKAIVFKQIQLIY